MIMGQMIEIAFYGIDRMTEFAAEVVFIYL